MRIYSGRWLARMIVLAAPLIPLTTFSSNAIGSISVPSVACWHNFQALATTRACTFKASFAASGADGVRALRVLVSTGAEVSTDGTKGANGADGAGSIRAAFIGIPFRVRRFLFRSAHYGAILSIKCLGVCQDFPLSRWVLILATMKDEEIPLPDDLKRSGMYSDATPYRRGYRAGYAAALALSDQYKQGLADGIKAAASRGGSATTEAKRKASAENGRKGGRPPKQA